jgi:hypothetical protein
VAFYLIKAKYSAQGFRGLLQRPQDMADSTKVVLAACGAGPCEIFIRSLQAL